MVKRISKLGGFTNRKGNSCKPKYFDAKCFRGIKKTIRCLTESKTLSKGMFCKGNMTPKRKQLWRDLEDLYDENSGFFKSKSEMAEKTRIVCKKVLSNFYADRLMRGYYNICIKIAFCDLEPCQLCRNFEMNCCPNEEHKDCLEKWKEFESFLSNDYLNEFCDEMPNNRTNDEQKTRSDMTCGYASKPSGEKTKEEKTLAETFENCREKCSEASGGENDDHTNSEMARLKYYENDSIEDSMEELGLAKRGID